GHLGLGLGLVLLGLGAGGGAQGQGGDGGQGQGQGADGHDVLLRVTYLDRERRRGRCGCDRDTGPSPAWISPSEWLWSVCRVEWRIRQAVRRDLGVEPRPPRGRQMGSLARTRAAGLKRSRGWTRLDPTP